MQGKAETMAARGAHIRARRKLVNLSVAAFAQAVGCHEGTVWRWENGKSEPSPAAMVSIARALQVKSAARLYYAGEVVEL